MILLVNMPFASLTRPSLALSLFKAQLDGAGIPSRVENLNFPFARIIGVELFEMIAQRRGIDAQVGEWLFARDAWRGEVDTPLELCCDIGRSGMAERAATLNRVRDEVVPPFLDECCDRLLAGGSARIVAFSCAFFQTLPALALARLIKEREPAVTTLFGGPNFHGEMGEELLAGTGWVDIVATAEADDMIVPLCKDILSGKGHGGMRGIAYRDGGGEVRSEPRPAPVTALVLDALPDPDYSAFIDDLFGLDCTGAGMIRERAYLPFEGSRGCWWGEKSHCTFCGLNPTGLAFRAKSPARVLATVENLARSYPIRRFFASDNNMPLDFFQGLWPEMAGSALAKECRIFYEVKPNLGRSQVRLLSEAGVRFLQPGIETLSTHLLRCMRKGLSGLIHVYFLKLCRLFNVWPCWNFLVGIPGERSEDYRRLVGLVPLIRHLTPPQSGIQTLQLHRFSPYYNEAERYLERFSPSRWYSALYPAGRVELDRVAYYFDAEWKDTLGSEADDYPELADEVQRWVGTWLDSPQLPGLTYDFMPTGRLELLDSRFSKTGIWSLDTRESVVYRAIDDPRTPAEVLALGWEGAGSLEEVMAVLAEFVRAGVAIEEGGRYLGLAIPDSTRGFSLTERRQLLQKARMQQPIDHLRQDKSSGGS